MTLQVTNAAAIRTVVQALSALSVQDQAVALSIYTVMAGQRRGRKPGRKPGAKKPGPKPKAKAAPAAAPVKKKAKAKVSKKKALFEKLAQETGE